MEGLATRMALGAPLQAWKSSAPRHPPLTARKPFRTSYPLLCSAQKPTHSTSNQTIKPKLKQNIAIAGGLVISAGIAVLSLQGIRPVLAAPPTPTSTSTSTSTSSPDLDSPQEEQIAKIFKEILLKDEDSSDPKPLPDQEELLKAFQRLPPEFQKEVVKNTLIAPLVAGNIDMAIDMVESLIRETPGDVDWKLMKAYILDDADRTHEAKLAFEEILKEQPYNAHALQGLATAMHKSGEDAAMIKRLEELVQKAQEHEGRGVAYNMKLVLAHVYIVQENFEEAMKQYQLLIDENPQDFRPYLCQGIIYSVLDKKDEAKERFEKYSELVPESFSKEEFLDDVMLKVRTEAEKISQLRKKEQKLMEEGESPDEAKQSEKPMQEPRFR